MRMPAQRRTPPPRLPSPPQHHSLSLQSSIFEDSYEVGEYSQDFDECVAATKVSYLINYAAFNDNGTGYEGLERASAEAAALTMGYQYLLLSATLSASRRFEEQVVPTVCRPRL